MQTRHRNPFTTLRTEGAILPPDLLHRIRENDADLGGAVDVAQKLRQAIAA